jgi:hypothetical protein
MSLQLELDSLSLDDLSRISDLPTLSDPIEAGNNQPSCLKYGDPDLIVLEFDELTRREDELFQMLSERGLHFSLGIVSDNTHDPESEDAD